MATHSSVLAWRIPGTVEPGGLPSMGLHRVGHDWSDLAVAYLIFSNSLTSNLSCNVVDYRNVDKILSCNTAGLECNMRAAAAAPKLLQSCPTLCNPRDGSPPGSPIPGIPQARTLEWVAISFSNAWKWKVKVKSLSRVRLLATSWTAAYQTPPPMGFSRQEYWKY